MAENVSRTPTYVALAMTAAALVLASITGFSKGSIGGSALALAAALPSGMGMVKGMQEKTQGGLALAIGAFLLALAVGALLLILTLIHLFR